MNSTIAMPAAEEELALSLDGKRRGFDREDFIEKFATPHLFIKKEQAAKEIDSLIGHAPAWMETIKNSFLSEPMKGKYLALLSERIKRLACH